MGESFEIDEYLCASDVEEVDDEYDQGTTTAEIGYHHGYLNVPEQVIITFRFCGYLIDFKFLFWH